MDRLNETVEDWYDEYLRAKESCGVEEKKLKESKERLKDIEEARQIAQRRLSFSVKIYKESKQNTSTIDFD